MILTLGLKICDKLLVNMKTIVSGYQDLHSNVVHYNRSLVLMCERVCVGASCVVVSPFPYLVRSSKAVAEFICDPATLRL